MPFSRAPAEAAVREDARADQPQRQGDDDQQRGDEPRRAVAQVHCAQIVHAATDVLACTSVETEQNTFFCHV